MAAGRQMEGRRRSGRAGADDNDIGIDQAEALVANTCTAIVSDLEDVGFLGRQLLLQLGDVAVGELLYFLLLIAALVFGKLPLLLLLLDAVDAVAADVAQRNLALFSVFCGQLAELLAAILGERRDVDANQLTVVVAGETEIAHADRLLDQVERAAVKRLNLDGLRIGS